MTEFQAAVLTKQYERFVDQDATRQENGRYLEEELAKIPGLSPRKRYEPDTRFTYVWFEMNYDPSHFEGVPAERFAEALRAEGMPFMGGARRYYERCHREGMLEEHLGTRGFETVFSAARLKAYRESLTFPVMDGLTGPTTEMLEMDSKIPFLGERPAIEGIVEAFPQGEPEHLGLAVRPDRRGFGRRVSTRPRGRMRRTSVDSRCEATRRRAIHRCV